MMTFTNLIKSNPAVATSSKDRLQKSSQLFGLLKMIARAMFLLALLIGGLPESALGQTPSLAEPIYSARDDNHVDMVSGSPWFSVTDLQIGSKEHPLAHSVHSSQTVSGGNWADNYFWSEYPASPYYLYGTSTQATTIRFVLGDSSELFYQSGSSWVSWNLLGSTLTSGSGYVYTLKDGTRLVVGSTSRAISITYPDGRVLQYNYSAAGRLQSLTRSDGLQLKYNYASNTQGANGYNTVSSVVAINNAYDYCAPSADTCTTSLSWPTATYSSASGTFTVTDAANRVTRFTLDSLQRITGVKLPSSQSADNFTYTYCNSACYTEDANANVTYFPNMISRVVRDGTTWTYNYVPTQTDNGQSPYTSSSSIQNGAVSAVLTQAWPYFRGPLFSVGLIDGKRYFFDPNSYSGLVTEVSWPEGNYTNYTRDARGNITLETMIAKSGSGLSNRTLQANYDTSCTNAFTCNKPHYVIDARGNQTDYVWDPNHGGISKETLPAPASGQPRPETRYTYAQRYAYIKNASGSYVASVTPIWVLTQTSICQKGAPATSGVGCATAGDVSFPQISGHLG